jgi:hypothetical protein
MEAPRITSTSVGRQRARESSLRSAIEINFEGHIRKILDCCGFGIAIILVIGVIFLPSTHLAWTL